MNGATARLVQPGDRVIVICMEYEEAELAEYAPIIVHVDDTNTPITEDEAQRQGSNSFGYGIILKLL